MILLHRLNGKEFVLNSDQIKFIEATPDTLVTLMQSDEKFMVRETVAEVIELSIEYKKKWLWEPLEHRKR